MFDCYTGEGCRMLLMNKELGRKVGNQRRSYSFSWTLMMETSNIRNVGVLKTVM